MNDQLPKVICEDCAFKVDELFNFRQKVLQTEGMFMEMLKALSKSNINALNEITIKDIQGNMNELQNGIDSVESHNIIRQDVQNGLHFISHREDVSSQEELNSGDNDVGVASFHLDGDTVRMVDEQIGNVSLFIITILI